MRRLLRTYVTTIRIEKNTGSPWASFPKPKAFFEKLEKWKKGLESDLGNFSGGEAAQLTVLIDTLEGLCAPRRVQYPHYDFTREEVDRLLLIRAQNV